MPTSTAVPRDMHLAVSVTDAARAVGVGRSTMWTLIARGEIPVVRVERWTLVRVDALWEWLAARERRGGAR